MPLPDDEWTKGKCGLKGLQYMALGIPVIMSPVGVNSTIVEDGVNGYLAKEPEAWIRPAFRPYSECRVPEEDRHRRCRAVIERYSVKAQRQTYLHHLSALVSNNG